MFDTSFSKEPQQNQQPKQEKSILKDIIKLKLKQALIKFTAILDRKFTHQKLLTFEVISHASETIPKKLELFAQETALRVTQFSTKLTSTINSCLDFQKQWAFHRLHLVFKVEKLSKKVSVVKSGLESNIRSKQESINLKNSTDLLKGNNAKLKDRLKSKKVPFEDFSKKIEDLLLSHEHFLDNL